MSHLIWKIYRKILEKPQCGKPIVWLQYSNSRQISCASIKFQKAAKLEISEDTSRTDNVKDKIIYNTKIKALRPLDEKIEKYLLEQEIQKNYESKGPPLIALKYFTNNLSDDDDDDDSIKRDAEERKKVQFPYAKHDNVTVVSSNIDLTCDAFDEDVTETNTMSFKKLKDLPCKLPKKKWMRDYDKYAEIHVKHHHEDKEEPDDEDSIVGSFDYGTADPNIPASSVPCGGCGAHLHCQDIAIPGFLPKEIFAGQRTEQLQSLVCQRCHFLREYDTALSVSVDPGLYPELISRIKSQKALVILVVDMTDFPCSIWPGIFEIIGPRRPLVVVGNKVDLLQDWSEGWLERAKQSLLSHLPPRLNVLHTEMVSAKTGYGIEQLITKLWRLWEYRGDVYLVGCTNVGKSTLFNLLLNSDYCKTKAVDLIQRATTSPWPGTTLNLLKFPILRPEGWRVASRTLRLREGSDKPEAIQKGEGEHTPQMITAISHTFSQGNADRTNDEYWDDPFAMPKLSTLKRIKADGSGIDPNDPMFAKSRWLYDTPGVITPDQIIDLLTTEELVTTLPQKPLVPRSFQLWPEHSIWLGGLGRLDYLQGPANIKVTVLAADTLPVTICPVRHCAEVYDQLLGSEALAVPRGSQDRLRLWPGLSPAPPFSLRGIGWQLSCADVVLSSAGWIAVTAQNDSLNQLQAWTPCARGIHVRIPPVLPRAIAVKGARLFRSPAYAIFNDYIKANR